MYSFIKKLESSKITLIAGIIIAYVFAAAYLFYYLYYKVYLIGSDSYYYLAIADSIGLSGDWKNISVIPAEPINTFQLGITFFYYLLTSFNLEPVSRMIIVVWLNFGIHLTALIPLFYISRQVGIRNHIDISLIFIVSFGAWHVWRMQLIPINDGIFNSLSLYVVWGFIHLLTRLPSNLPETDISRKNFKYLLISLALGCFLLSFLRVQMFLILISIALVSLVIVRSKSKLIFLFLTIALATLLLSWFTKVYLNYDFVMNVTVYFKHHVFFVGGHVFKIMFGDVVPTLMVSRNTFFPWLINIIVVLSLTFSLYKSIREKNIGLLVITIITITAIFFVGRFRYRYVTYIFPFLYMILFRIKFFKPIGYVLAVFAIAFGLNQLRHEFYRAPGSHFWLYLHTNPTTLRGDNRLLISSSKYHPYVLLKERVYHGTLNWDVVFNRDYIYILGDKETREEKLKAVSELFLSRGYIFRKEELMSDQNFEDGWGITQLMDFGKKDMSNT